MSSNGYLKILIIKSLVLMSSTTFAENLFLEGVVSPRIGVDVSEQFIEVQSTPDFEFHVNVEVQAIVQRGPASESEAMPLLASSFKLASHDAKTALNALPAGSYKVEFRAP